jgi:rubrerythrin
MIGVVMPNFPDPFVGADPKQLSKADLIQAIRIDIAGELEAMFLYDAHARATDDELVRKTLFEIRDEEREHTGELISLLRYLDPTETDLLLEGQGEVREKAEKLGVDFKRLLSE